MDLHPVLESDYNFNIIYKGIVIFSSSSMPPRGAPSRGGSSRGRGANNSPNIGAHVATVGVKRPNFGTVGRDLAVYVNSFKTTIPESVIHHYDGKEPRFPASCYGTLMLSPQLVRLSS
jgi:hypothetical protein